MTSSSSPKPSKPPHKKRLHPSEHDAEVLRRHYPLSILLKLLTLLAIAFVLIIVAFFIMAGSDRGTQFIVDKIINETGVNIEYAEGNLRDGLLVKDLALSASENIEVHIIDAYVQIGWRAMFRKEVHFRDATIGRIEIINHKPPTGEPFDYKTLELPVNLRFDDVKIDAIEYDQAQRDPVIVTDVIASDLNWIDTKVTVDDAVFQYSDVLHVADLHGFIDLEGDYPLDADAVITVNSLEKVYIDPIDVSANGSLKRTTGTVRSKYNNKEVQGEFVVQGLDDNSPFNAKLSWDEIDIPYAESQKIMLYNGVAIASGVVSDIELRISTDLSGKNLPVGRYQGYATIADSQMQIERLVARTDDGQLSAQGRLDWQSKFKMDATVQSQGYNIRTIVPQDYKVYAPQSLDGVLDFKYQTQTKEGQQQYVIELDQNDGEYIKATIDQGVEPENVRFKAPWYIDATWKNLQRQNIPNIGDIDSPYGSAEVQIRDNRLWADAKGRINELNAAPQGNYDVKIAKHDNNITIRDLAYTGVIGDLKGQGEVILATDSTPLTWQIEATTTGLNPNAYQSSLPVDSLVGSITASGSMVNTKQRVGGKLVRGQRHEFNITSTDLNAQINSESDTKNLQQQGSQVARIVKVNGSGSGWVTLTKGNVQQFSAKFNGDLDTQGIPSGDIVIDAEGNTKVITINTLKHNGEAGALSASGKIDLRDGVKWDVTANTQEFDVGFITPQTQGIVTGDLVTSGHWRDNGTKYGDLSAFTVDFDGSLDAPKLPKGQLKIKADGDAQAININEFSHIGSSGRIIAKGKVDVTDGINWQLSTVMNNFNLGYFIKDAPSTLTGRIDTTGKWQDDVQRINISNIALTGQLKGQPLTAQGNLDATLHLPTDMNDYLTTLQASDTEGQVNQVRTLIDTLSVNDLAIIWGDNHIVANGDAQNLQAEIDVRHLDRLSDTLRGEVVGGITMKQPNSNSLPTLYMDLSAKNIQLNNFSLSSGVIKGKLVDLGKSNSMLALSANDLQASNTSFNALSAVFDGTQAAHVLKLSLGNDQATIDATMKGALSAKDDGWRWSGIMGAGEISSEHVRLQQRQPAQIIADIGADPTQTQLQIAAHCWQAENQYGKFCLRENLVASKQQGQVDLIIQELDTKLISPFLPNDIAWQAKVNGKAVVGWQQGEDPTINTSLYSDNGVIGLNNDDSSSNMNLSYNRVSVIAVSVAEGLQLRTDIDMGRGGKGYADVVIDPYDQNKSMSGVLVLNDINIAIFKPFFPGMRTLQGNVTMAGDVDGTLSSPVFEGNIKLRDAQIAMLDLPINLSNINATANVHGKSADVSGSFNSGEGEGSITGSINWQQQLQAKLSIIGERLIVTQPPMLFAAVSPDIDVIVRPSDKYVNIEGTVAVPVATIRPPEASDEIITQSEDVVVLDRRLIGNIDEVLAITKPWSINADIGVDLGSNVNFRGFGAVLPLAGAINVTQQGMGVTQGVGVVQVSRRSNIDAFGQSLELNYGQLRFNGDIQNPQLSIEAVKEIESQIVGLRVKGEVADPNIIVFNNAGLTQQQAMNALVTGRISNAGATQISEEGFKSEVTNNLAAAGLSIGLSGTRSLTNTIGRAFGLERLTVDASGSDNDANVNVTGYITPDLYIRYGVGVFNAQSSLALRYQITRRIYIEATSAAENAVDVVYSWKF